MLGKPDFVFREAKVALFVDGCFWHGCPRCYRAPTSSPAYWLAKIRRNRKRDLQVSRHLRGMGWKVARVRECQLKAPARFMKRLVSLLHSP
jgi:DNA mismatch endonuclease, patch repair protein